jgi:hypothetical protein
MDRINPAIVSSDTWILLALWWASREQAAGLQEILYSADGINKAIPTAEELDGALNRLLAAGLISLKGGRFQLTDLAHTTIAKVSKKRQGILDLWENVARLLACPCCGPNLRSVRRRVSITRPDVRRAYIAYVKQVDAELGRTSK